MNTKCLKTYGMIKNKLIFSFFLQITHTKLFLTAGESEPSINLTAALVKSAKPRTGRYSWSKVISEASCCSTALTTGNTHGLLFSSLYALLKKTLVKS